VLVHQKASNHSSLWHIFSLSGNTGGQKEDHDQNCAGKNRPSTVSFFDANQVFVYIHSIEDLMDRSV